MIRAAAIALVGAAGGFLLSALLMWLTSMTMDWKSSQTLRIEHWVIYLCLTLGAGFGALTGAVIGCFRLPAPPR